MVKLEERLRTSTYVLAEFGKCVDSGERDWMDLVEPLVQRPVVRAFGYTEPAAELRALAYLRTQPQTWPKESAPFWIRHNRARQPDLKSGDPAPTVSVYPLNPDGTVAPAEPLHTSGTEIIVAGSIT